MVQYNKSCLIPELYYVLPHPPPPLLLQRRELTSCTNCTQRGISKRVAYSALSHITLTKTYRANGNHKFLTLASTYWTNFSVWLDYIQTKEQVTPIVNSHQCYVSISLTFQFPDRWPIRKHSYICWTFSDHQCNHITKHFYFPEPVHTTWMIAYHHSKSSRSSALVDVGPWRRGYRRYVP